MSNYPAGVTNKTIDDYFGPDEPEETEEVITPRDILSRLIQEATGEGRRMAQSALEYLWREHRLDDATGTARYVYPAQRLDAQMERRHLR